ncbi:hypothetical protein N1F89_12320 [Aquibium sp. A9E412]|uniref:DUF6867 family protein n=1 Tax=Aquibium sp. A9E412 TaxID=2976767 RepID=UPI0025B19647|nr:hypothetical protein [Aquibium sp. A9E412]MDN2567006.1 hypothetical protein [Aquibium sp. A9E412]
MENENALLWEVSASEFVFVTVILAGSAAYLTGRAMARGWLADAQLVFYIVLLAAATRFIHFALFGGTLLAPYYYAVDLLVLLVVAFAGKRLTRARQMAVQYSFKYARRGLFGWQERPGGKA